MSFIDHNGESVFPFPSQQVFSAICQAIPLISGMRINSADSLQCRIVVSAGISLRSWGENIPIQIMDIDNNRSIVKITSTPKTGVMFGGAADFGKNRENIEAILQQTSLILQQQLPHSEIPHQQPFSTFTSPNNATCTNVFINNPPYTPWYNYDWLVLVLCILFWPVGLYALWKNTRIGKSWKIIWTVCILFFFVFIEVLLICVATFT